ncbi:hypothetical protein DL766_002208 [Monosporascus sp. MC13-8B]|uniref:Uncharacterized protein n=1 Tax=Monosporascus cannonballus TaxID=155416 RepID=A0ABY0GTV4_9PEZI|nr:hypothetical protein DL762_010499 [Monosporascus cannonballus]RYO80592.1 hypothetical protein DL763_008858 [Monosporascus cannonballus]RYP36026.1 hypothetical protein DL766_002208 [Monosporascus sp. MC13-8B]
MADDRDPFSPPISTTSSSNNPTVQSKRPGLKRHNTDVSRLSDQSNNHHRSNISKNPRHGHGHGPARVHARVPSSKKSVNRRQPSPSSPERLPMIASAHHTGQHHHHRRATSEVRLQLPRQASSAATLKKNSSHTNIGFAGKRNRSHVEIAKRPKPSAANLKRSSSHKEVNKLKGAKSQVHFDLGNDDELEPDLEGVQDDEWVDASNSASPYLSRRGSVVSTGQSSTTREDPDDDNDSSDAVASSPSKPHTPANDHSDDQEEEDRSAPPIDRETIQHKEYITSRLLKRTPSSSAPPKMTAETASVRPKPSLPESRGDASSAYGTPKTSALVGSGGDELTSRFVSGSGPSAESGSFCTPTRSPTHRTGSMPRPRSLANLEREHRDSISDDEGDSALAPRTRRPAYKPQPAEKSRTQQKLNLQRASSSIEPAQPGGGAGVGGVSPLVGGSSYDNRDPRVGKLLERTGMEYLVVRRYQNPIARSISRLSRMPVSQKHRRIPKQNGANGPTHGNRLTDPSGPGHYNLSQSLGDAAKSRPTTPRRAASVRISGVGSSFDAQDERPQDRLSGSSYTEGYDDGVAALLRNLWDKNMMDLSTSQD